jgi:DNA (cytosine-5)-methyltransferase 1
LEGSGYTVGAAIVAAGGIGAPHVRKRLYFVANSRCAGWEGFINNDSISGSTLETQSRHSDNFALAWSALDDDFSGLLQRDGTTVGMERSMLHGYGNAIVPQAAKAFISAYMEIM